MKNMTIKSAFAVLIAASALTSTAVIDDASAKIKEMKFHVYLKKL